MLTLAQMESRNNWVRMHPEMRRRMVAMFDAAADSGRVLGFGGGWRSTATQTTLFLSRYTPVACPGDVRWDDRCWKKLAGVAAAAPPGRSYHEETTDDGFALAADLIGDLKWMNANCTNFGLLHFADVNNEPWHVQPVEIPRSRRLYTGQQLAVWPLPGTTPPPPTPVPPTDEDEDDVKSLTIVRMRGFWNAWLVGNSPPFHLSPELHAHYTKLGVPEIVVEPHPQMQRTLLFQCGLTEKDLVSSNGA
jgi:hypothetical protein